MIFYFSGTGNSLWIAKKCAAAFSDKLFSISDLLIANNAEITFSLERNEKIGFVFPIHSWGVPPIVLDFVKKLQFDNYANHLMYAICSCGDDCGLALPHFQKELAKRGWNLAHKYSVQMPNSYIVFPFFDVDSKEVEVAKKQKAKEAVPKIIDAIGNNQPINFYHQGSFPCLKSNLIYPLFCKYALNAKPYYTTDKCISCGLCVKVCPTKNISLKENKPIWGDNCTQCLACIHRCPERAIEYGKVSVKKGRYFYS